MEQHVKQDTLCLVFEPSEWLLKPQFPKPGPSAMRVWGPNHCSTREFPRKTPLMPFYILALVCLRLEKYPRECFLRCYQWLSLDDRIPHFSVSFLILCTSLYWVDFFLLHHMCIDFIFLKKLVHSLPFLSSGDWQGPCSHLGWDGLDRMRPGQCLLCSEFAKHLVWP